MTAPTFELGSICATSRPVSPYALAVHPKNAGVATSFGNVLAVCSARTGRQEHMFKIHGVHDDDAPARPVCCAFSPSGCHLAAAFDRSLHVNGLVSKVVVFATCSSKSKSCGDHDMKPLPSGPRGVCRQVAWSADAKYIAAAGTDPCVTLWTWPSAVCFATLTAAVPALALSWGQSAAPLGLMVASPGALVWCQVHLPAVGLDVTLEKLPGATLEPRVLDLSRFTQLHGAQELADLSSAEDGAVFAITRQGWVLRLWQERLAKFAPIHADMSQATRHATASTALQKSAFAVECAPGGRVACALACRTVRLFDGISLNALADLCCALPGAFDTLGLACGSTLWALYADGSMAGFSMDPNDKDSPKLLLMGCQDEALSASTALAALPLDGLIASHADGGTAMNGVDYFALCGESGVRFCSSSGVLAGLPEEEGANRKVSAVAVCGQKQVLLACGHHEGLVTGFALQPAVASPLEHFQNMPRFSIKLRSEAEVIAVGLATLTAPPEMSNAFDACCLVAAACGDATVEIQRLPFLCAGMQIVFGEPCSVVSMSETFQGGPLPALSLFDGGAVVDETGIFGNTGLLSGDELVVEQPTRRCAFLVTGGPQRLLVREITTCEGCAAGMRRVHQEEAHKSGWVGFCSTTKHVLALNSTVLAADGDGRMVEFEVTTGNYRQQTQACLSAGEQLIAPMGLSSGDRLMLLAGVSRQGAVQPRLLVIDVKTGDCIADLSEHAAPIRSVAFCRNSDRFAALTADGSLLTWQPEAKADGMDTTCQSVCASLGDECGRRAGCDAPQFVPSASSAPPRYRSSYPDASHARPPIAVAPPRTAKPGPPQQADSGFPSQVADSGTGSQHIGRRLPEGEVSASAVWDALGSSVADCSAMATSGIGEVTPPGPYAQEAQVVRVAFEQLLSKVEALGGLQDNSIDSAAVMELDRVLAVAEQRLRPLLYPPHARLTDARHSAR